ncbi:MAG: hypothetical protein KBT03_13900 [Bacteroidales bacterium]|nr:hypothetical protein [Candidatus Scybalousia scybalohippi]
MKKYLCFILSLSTIASLSAQQIISGKADKAEYMIGDRIEYSFSIPQTKDNVVLSTEYKFSDTLNMVSQSCDTNNGKINYHFTFASFVEGNVVLPKYIIYKHSGASALYSVNPPIVKVTIPVIDTVNIEAKPLKGIMKAPITFKEILPFCIGIVVLAGIIVGIIYYIKYLKKRKQNALLNKKEKKVLVAEDIEALNALNALREEHYIEKNQTKQHYISLTDILWQYIYRRFDVNAFEMTSGQIIDSLRNGEIKHEDLEKLSDIFSVADFVKFAKHNPSGVENLRVMQESVDFVNATKRIPVAELEKEKEDKI